MTQESKPRVLVTGAGGALAQEVIRRLKTQYNVIAVDFRYCVEMGDDVPSYCVQLTKRNFEDVFRGHRIDGVIHLGRIGSDELNRLNRYNANVLGTQNLLDLCIRYKVGQVLVLSTFYVYGASPFNPAMLDETYPLKASELTMDLVDSVELENLATIYLWKHRELNITILRPCSIVGPGIRNSMGKLLAQARAPALLGFSPMMQLIHLEDMADAIVLAYQKNRMGIYNVAPDDWVAYQDILRQCGCKILWLPSLPPLLPRMISKVVGWPGFPSYLINYFKYPVIIKGKLFADTFGFAPGRSLDDVFGYYRSLTK